VNGVGIGSGESLVVDRCARAGAPGDVIPPGFAADGKAFKQVSV
jgi:hypothetical protein